MVVDTSALLAVLFGEPEQEVFAAALAEAGVRLLAAFTALEASAVVLARKGDAGARELDLLFHQAEIEVVSFTEPHLRIARAAYRRFGKGRHPAALNLGDCCSYALAQYTGEPLLYKGNVFDRTDVLSAI